MSLPVEAVLPKLRAALAANAPVALVAPPGAGKTTAVAPALLGESWTAGGKLILLSPRRLAARAAAERMAEQAGEAVGATIGYRTRMDSRVSAATRIEVVTEGIFTRMLVADPELSGVAAVLFDEVHERSLDSDLALALALEAREALRPDLRLLLMSATLDGAAYQAIIPDLASITSEGRMFPVEMRHIGRDAAVRIEDSVASAIRAALAEEAGSILAFLPGAAEIERTAERLAERLPGDVDLHRLYGARDGADQRAAIRPPPPGCRKVVLATSIAETSITIDGVRVVIDSGLARRPRYDRAVGLTRLVTERASQAAVTQRAGRAGRTAPGIAIRLWEAGETAGRPRFDPPEILESDLSGLVLECARWGVSDLAALRWRDVPPAAAVAEARDRLAAIGALDADGRPTPHGERIAALPMAPVLGAMLVAGAARGLGRLAA
ncbi:ATP-dependent helicase, partial [alpha proteobacterium AAP81b]